MPKMTPEQEARHALAQGMARSGLSMAAQLAYDRMAAEGTPAGPLTRTPPDVRERILAMFKQAGDRYAMPFSGDRLAAVSLNEPWADYGQVILQMAILDTLLSIEEKLTALGALGTGQQDT
jgi:hypothetical protein